MLQKRYSNTFFLAVALGKYKFEAKYWNYFLSILRRAFNEGLSIFGSGSRRRSSQCFAETLRSGRSLVFGDARNQIRLVLALIFAALITLHAPDAWLAAQGEATLSRSNDLEALAAIHREFDLHTARKGQLTEEFKRIQGVLASTAKDMEKIQNEQIQKQMALEMLAWEQATARQAILESKAEMKALSKQGLADPDPGLRVRNERAMRSIQFQSQNDSISQMLERMQLDSAARTTIERRITTFRDGAKLEQDCAKWFEQRPTFFDRYWRFTDPNRIRTRAENEAILAVLSQRASDNYPAMIAQCLLEERLGKFDSALASIELVIKETTPLQNVAWMARAMVNTGLDQPKKVKSDMATSFKLDRTNATVRWMRAVLDASEKDWKAAESEATALLKSKEHELAARRLLVVIYAVQAKRIPRLAVKAMEQAQIVRDLSDAADWSSELLMSIALSVSGKQEEAVVTAESASSHAVDENQILCQKILTDIGAKKPLEWDFLRH